MSSAPRSIVAVITRKELREMTRDGRVRAVGVFILALLVVALWVGFRHAAESRAERSAAQRTAVERWQGQGEIAPHAATHYGMFVFKPVSPLAHLDPGIDPFVGAAVRLEAHRLNPLQAASARDGTSLERFGPFTVATILQFLLPLLVIAMAFAAFSGERETGTLRQLASLGISPVRLVAGKTLGIVAALALVLVPALVIGGGALALTGAEHADHGHDGVLGRMAALVGSYGLYLAVFLFLSLWVSASAPSSRTALVTLLGIWIAVTLILPRILVDLVVSRVDLPSSTELSSALDAELATGAPGGPTRKQRVADHTRALHAKLGVAAGRVPANLSPEGIELQAEAHFENEVFDRHMARYWEGIERQESLLALASVLSPLVAVRSLSMALSGTDVSHQRDFEAAAERHRRLLVEVMNDDMIRNAAGRGWDYKGDRNVWAKVPPFEYQPPSVWSTLRHQLPSGLALCAWLAIAMGGTWLTARRLRV